MFFINGVAWRIQFVSRYHPTLFRSDGSLTLGSCDDEAKTIYISSEITDLQLMKKVLCHELTHAAMFSYKIYLDLGQEEILADLVATYGQEIVSITNRIFNNLLSN